MATKKKAAGKTTRRVVPTVPTFTFPDGTVVELMEIPMMLSAEYYNSEVGKPEPPMKPMPNSIGGIEVPDEEDPDYKAKLGKWETEHWLEVARLCALMGVKTDPSADDPTLEKLMYISKDAKPAELKCKWIMAKLTTTDSIGEFTEAVIAQTALTEEGVEEASDPERFRDLGERKASNGAHVPQPALVGDSGTDT